MPSLAASNDLGEVVQCRFLQRAFGFAPAEISARVNIEVIEQHTELAPFLWCARDAAVRAPHYTLKDLARLDERLEANLDGLRIAGEAGWQSLAAALDRPGSGELFAAAVLAVDVGERARIDRVLELACTEPELERGLISALGWLPFTVAKNLIKELLEEPNPDRRRLGVAAAAAHRKDPGPILASAIGSSDRRLRARSLRAAGELGRCDLLDLLAQSLTDPDEICRFTASWSAARLGDRNPATFRVLCSVAEFAGPLAEQAVRITVGCLPVAKARAWIRTLAEHSGTRRVAVIGAGALGDPDLMIDLIASMGDELLARVAGEAFSLVTGVDLARKRLEGTPPAVPPEDPEREAVDIDPDEDLAWPIPSRVAEWWQQQRVRYAPGNRYICGQPLTKAALVDTLRDGLQRQRDAAALELALMMPRQPMFEVRAPAQQQQALLA